MSNVAKLPYCLTFNGRPLSARFIAKLIQSGCLHWSRRHDIASVEDAIRALRRKSDTLLSDDSPIQPA
jgi:uncharacterized protein YjiS (DUF1127 family)